MAFFYPMFSSFEPTCSTIYSLIAHQKSQLQTTKILILNAQICSNSFPKNDSDISNLQTVSTILDLSNIPEFKGEIKSNKKQIKKQYCQKKDQNFGYRKQNKDRNVLSGILKSYIQFTINNQKMRRIIENLSNKMVFENGVQIFYKFLSQTFPQRKSYVGIKQMRKFLKGQQNGKEIARLLATSLHHYLFQIYPLTICLGDKQEKKVKLSLLKRVRNLRSSLFQS